MNCRVPRRVRLQQSYFLTHKFLSLCTEMTQLQCFRRRGIVSLIMVFTIVIILLYTVNEESITSFQPEFFRYRLFGSGDVENIDFHRNLASQLAEVLRDLSAEQHEVNPHILLKLSRIISQLDSRLNPGSIWNNSIVPDTCGDAFMGTKYGYPFYEEGFKISPSCNQSEKHSVCDLVSIVIVSDDVEQVLQSIQNTYPQIQVIYGTTLPEESIKRLTTNFNASKAIKIKKYGPHVPASIWNKLIAEVKTPYTLIGRRINGFSHYSALERQLHIISSSNKIGVVGGAFRNNDGYWKIGCLQSKIENYFLKYYSGYLHSDRDCMFCDHLEGPFITKTKILHEIPLSDSFVGPVVFADWFLHLKESNILVMNCPDVMYFTDDKETSLLSTELAAGTKNIWQKFVSDWDIYQIGVSQKILYKFTCEEANLSCRPRNWVKAYLLPPCCLKQVADSMTALNTIASKMNIAYEIDGGLLLGAVKLGSFLPWDIDGDIMFKMKDYSLFYSERNNEIFTKKQISLTGFSKKRNYFQIFSPDIKLEMWGMPELTTKHLPKHIQGKPTKVNILGVWVQSPANPGLFVRNRYGPNFLKHAQWWGFLHMKDSWVNYTSSGRWLPCPKRSHHACLSHYPGDGSLAFQLPSTNDFLDT